MGDSLQASSLAVTIEVVPERYATKFARMGGKARAEALTPSQRKAIADKAAAASAAARAACEHLETERRFSSKTGKKLPGKYCVSCRRKVV